MGNVRVSYCDVNSNGSLAPTEVMEETNYYPFGLAHKGYNVNVYSTNVGQKNKYNDREFEKALGLNMNEMDWRQYDVALGRFVVIDPLSELTPGINNYSFGFNNAAYFSDPTGLTPLDPTDDAFWYNAFINSNSGTTWSAVGGGVFQNNQGEVIDASGNLFASLHDLYFGEEGLPGTILPTAYTKTKYRKNKNSSDGLHIFLDIVGTFDPFDVADGLNVIIYLAEGDYANASIAAVAILPFGDLAKGLKYAKKDLKGAKKP